MPLFRYAFAVSIAIISHSTIKAIRMCGFGSGPLPWDPNKYQTNLACVYSARMLVSWRISWLYGIVWYVGWSEQNFQNYSWHIRSVPLHKNSATPIVSICSLSICSRIPASHTSDQSTWYMTFRMHDPIAMASSKGMAQVSTTFWKPNMINTCCKLQAQSI